MEKDYRLFETLPSTNGYARKYCATFDKKKVIIIHALGQTEAYGQKKKVFFAPKNGGIWMSICLFGADDLDPIIAIRKMAETVQKYLHSEQVEATIKWPNDLLVNGKKIAGILTEIVDGWLIIGLGLNIALTKEQMENIDQPVTCLEAVTGKKYSVQELATILINSFLS